MDAQAQLRQNLTLTRRPFKDQKGCRSYPPHRCTRSILVYLTLSGPPLRHRLDNVLFWGYAPGFSSLSARFCSSEWALLRSARWALDYCGDSLTFMSLHPKWLLQSEFLPPHRDSRPIPRPRCPNFLGDYLLISVYACWPRLPSIPKPHPDI
jgi:hypothetical protein